MLRALNLDFDTIFMSVNNPYSFQFIKIASEDSYIR